MRSIHISYTYTIIYHVCMYLCMYVCIYLCMYVCMCVCVMCMYIMYNMHTAIWHQLIGLFPNHIFDSTLFIR